MIRKMWYIDIWDLNKTFRNLLARGQKDANYVNNIDRKYIETFYWIFKSIEVNYMK